MADRKPVWFDPSKQATEHLNSVLTDKETLSEDLVILDDKLREKTAEDAQSKDVLPRMTVPEAVASSVPATEIKVQEARNEAPLLEEVSNRSRSRLLLFTKDATVLEEGSITNRRIADLRNQFLEVHVVLLNYASGTENAPILRLFDTVWIYATYSRSWWHLSYDAYKLAESQLVFSGGFRADVIVAEDLFESGLSAYFLSQKYERPFQLHIYEDFFDESFIDSLEHPTLYAWSVRHLLGHVESVRTKTEFQRQAVIERHSDLEPVTELLPSFYNLEAWRDAVPTFNLKERYPQFKFIILHISSMRNSSHSMEVITGSAPILKRYGTIGLVIVGNGPLRGALEHQVIALGLQNQVEFEPMPNEVMSHMKTAHMFIHLSEDGSEDDLILESAVAKLPLIGNKDGLAGKLFVDGESACLCSAGDSACVGNYINMYLNENQDRSRFALNASEIVFERIEQDYGAYLTAYRESIERCMVVAG